MNRNWEDLANAIILQAVDDYRKCRRRVRQQPDQKEAQAMIREIIVDIMLVFACFRLFAYCACVKIIL